MTQKILVKFFAFALIALAGVMIYNYFKFPIEVLQEGRISVKSRYSDKIVSAPTRQVRQGWREFWQVGSPDGSWYECRAGDCAETLRIEYVDHAFKHPYAPEPGSSSPYQSSR
jgi:hypothetical protein